MICSPHGVVTLERASNTSGRLSTTVLAHCSAAAAGPAAQLGCCVDEHRPDEAVSQIALVSVDFTFQ